MTSTLQNFIENISDIYIELAHYIHQLVMVTTIRHIINLGNLSHDEKCIDYKRLLYDH